MTIRSLVLSTASLAALVALTDFANAGAFGLREFSATAEGMSFAGAASGSGGISSMFWNPAVITMKPGWNSEYNASIIDLSSHIDPIPPTPNALLNLGPSGEIGRTALVPASFSSYQLTDRVWIGLSSTSPFGLATKPNQIWAGEEYARSSNIVSFNFNPIIGVKVTDWLSVAAGPALEYLSVKLRNALPIPLTPPSAWPSGWVKGHDWGVGFTAGATITPWAGTQVGVGYRSSIHHELEGSASLGLFGGPVQLNLNTPEKVSVGLTQAITPRLRLNLGFEWDNWSRLKSPAIVSVVAGPVRPFPINYRDGYLYSVGGEFDATDRLTLRAGVAYEESPVTDFNRTPRLPDNDRIWASLGASYRVTEKLSASLAYSHLFVKKSTIAIVAGQPSFLPPLPLVAEAEGSANIVSLSIKYRWDNPQVAIPAPAVAPVVRKY